MSKSSGRESKDYQKKSTMTLQFISGANTQLQYVFTVFTVPHCKIIHRAVKMARMCLLQETFSYYSQIKMFTQYDTKFRQNMYD